MEEQRQKVRCIFADACDRISGILGDSLGAPAVFHGLSPAEEELEPVCSAMKGQLDICDFYRCSAYNNNNS